MEFIYRSKLSVNILYVTNPAVKQYFQDICLQNKDKPVQ